MKKTTAKSDEKHCDDSVVLLLCNNHIVPSFVLMFSLENSKIKS
jgi:hypothetical protein